MFESIQIDAPTTFGAKIKVIGVGGGGGNAVNNLIDAELGHVEFMAANTDAQALGRSRAATRLQLGQMLTRGLGAGGKPETGAKAAMEDMDALHAAVADADMVFITAGMGGGTGTGAAPVVAQAARAAGALTVAVVTRPFGFEGINRMRQADEGLRALAEHVDTLIVIPNDRILNVADKRISFKDAFKLVDAVVVEAVRGISDIILTPGLVNVDFADVVAIMKDKGVALMGTGRATGDDRAKSAARQAISSPLLEDARIEGATGLLVAIAGSDLSLADINDAMTLIQESAAAETNTIFGAIIDESLGDEIKVTVVATGFDPTAAQTRTMEMVQLLSPRERSLNVPPPPIPTTSAAMGHLRVTAPLELTSVQDVQVYATAGHGQMAQASQSFAAPVMSHASAQTSQVVPAVRRAPNDGFPVDLDEPAYTRRTPSYGTNQAHVQAALQPRSALAQGPLQKREPVVGNPFAQDDGQEMDRPAFMRK